MRGRSVASSTRTSARVRPRSGARIDRIGGSPGSAAHCRDRPVRAPSPRPRSRSTSATKSATERSDTAPMAAAGHALDQHRPAPVGEVGEDRGEGGRRSGLLAEPALTGPSPCGLVDATLGDPAVEAAPRLAASEVGSRVAWPWAASVVARSRRSLRGRSRRTIASREYEPAWRATAVGIRLAHPCRTPPSGSASPATI